MRNTILEVQLTQIVGNAGEINDGQELMPPVVLIIVKDDSLL